MSQVTINGASLGTQLGNLLMADMITPGSMPSYELCKIIYEWHPLGGKMAEAPITMAQSQKRDISVPAGPESRLVEAFRAEWEKIGADDAIFNTVRIARIYGVGSVGLLTEGEQPGSPVDFDKLYKQTIAFNVWDPLNTAGSLVLNQVPTAMDFLKESGVAVSGTGFHRSRTVVKFNERPIYLGYTTSAFGYVGRSVYQRALYPLKSFVQTMRTDDMVSRKSGVLIAKIKQAGSIIDNLMQNMFAQKRNVVKESETDNVISISPDEAIETLNMQNIDGAYGMARTNILKNIATAADMPARLLENETMVSGFGEGTEDAKAIAQYIDRMRIEMAPLYAFFDTIVQYRAWNPDFYKTIQQAYPEEYGSVSYAQAFYAWRNSFRAEWPSLLTEPDSEKIKVDEARLKAIIAMVQVLLPEVDPENKALIIQWAADNFNELPLLFTSPLELDYEALAEYTPPEAQESLEPKPSPPFSAHDADVIAPTALRELAMRVESARRLAA